MKLKLFILLLAVALFSGCACHCNAVLLECPSIGKHDNVVYHKGYTLCYNSDTHTSDWVAYELTAEETQALWPRTNDFRYDPDVLDVQAEHSDYRGTGWHRGHLAPAGDMKWDSVAMSESFYYTNISPQSHALNQGCWQTLENKVRKWAVQYERVYVCCGPIYTTNRYGTLGSTSVKIPDYYFKALLIPVVGHYSAIAFIMENGEESQDLSQCACTVDALECILHRDLFCLLKDSLERKVESTIHWEDWGLERR